MTLRVMPGSQQIGLAAEVMNSHAKIPAQKKQGMCVCAPDPCRFSCTIHTTPSCVSKYHGVQLTRSCFHPNVSTIRLTKDVFLVYHWTTKSSYSFEIDHREEGPSLLETKSRCSSALLGVSSSVPMTLFVSV